MIYGVLIGLGCLGLGVVLERMLYNRRLLKKENQKFGSCDLNGDGSVTSTDAMQALRTAAQLRVLDAVQILIMDVNGDGTITSTDAMQILRVAAQLRTVSW